MVSQIKNPHVRNRMWGGVRGRKTKVGKNYFVFLLLDFVRTYFLSYEKNVFLCMITL
ncbi:hypothetical protein IMSAGC001_02429 [Bacteroides acidifaciens]|uniref:Uncharacterized protein n=1 Tax=Bacteroides acidifaciens TaxID=85831 RepID=A0A7J0A3Q5_9BACE|nr:hypothetical protein IMSAGC001_02429 [Bacteroides acidifaciens]